MSIAHSCLLLLAFCTAAPVAALENHAVAFIYHRFGDSRFPSTNVTIAQFDAQLRYLEQNRFQVLPLPTIVTALRNRTPLPDRSVAITIDDAYASFYRNGYPRLKARGWPFTVFVATDPVDGGEGDYMNWAQLRELAAHGGNFGNHSASHAHLLRRRPDEDHSQWMRRVSTDIQRGGERLRAQLGAAATMLFAYPYGEYDTALANRIQQLGYVGFGQESGALGEHSDLRALPRYPVAGPYASLDEFSLKAATLPLRVVQQTPWDPVVDEAHNPPLLTVRFAEQPARWDALACYASGQGRITVTRQGASHQVQVQAPAPLAPGRGRYNCTAPAQSDPQRFYWFSQPWVLLKDGAYPDD